MKSLDRRLYEVLTDIPRLLGPTFGPGANGLQMALIEKLNGLSTADVQLHSAKLTLAGAGAAGAYTRLPFHTDHRQLVRILVLLERLYPNNPLAARTREGKNNFSSASRYGNKAYVLAELKKYRYVAETVIAGGGFSYFGSNPAHQLMVETGSADAKALLSVIRTRLNDLDVAEMVNYWFGAAPEVITEKIGRLFHVINSEKIYFIDKPENKGEYGSVNQNKAFFKGEICYLVELGENFFNNRSARYPKLVDAATAESAITMGLEFLKRRAHVTRGPLQDWRKTRLEAVAYRYTNPIHPESKVSWAGTIIHELTHVVLHTDDHRVSAQAPAGPVPYLVSKYAAQNRLCYGPYLCRQLVLLDPAKAITNADNYRLFCETFFKNLRG